MPRFLGTERGRLHLYRLHQTSQEYGARPSSLLGLTGPRLAWFAYQYDTAAATLGRYVDNKLAETDSKGRRKHKLDAILADRKSPEGAKKRYRSAGPEVIGKSF